MLPVRTCLALLFLLSLELQSRNPWATLKTHELQTANWLSHKTKLHSLCVGTSHQVGEHVYLLAFVYKLPHYPVPFCVFVLWVKWYVLVVFPKLRVHCTLGTIQDLLFRFILHFGCLFVVAYGFQHVHMAMTQKEPGPSKKSIVSQCQACQAYTYNSIHVSWRLSRLWAMFGGAILVYSAPYPGSWLLHERRTTLSSHYCFPSS